MKKFFLLSMAAVIGFGFGVDANARGMSDYLKEKGVITGNYYPDISMLGRLHLDAGFHDEDTVGFGDGLTVRRARMGISGDLDPDWSFTIEYDFAEEDTSANDVMFERKFGDGALKIGQFKVPMGLNELTSSNDITFIERAANSNVIVDARRIGLGFEYHHDLYGLHAMTYSRAMGDRESGDMPLGIAARGYANPVYHDDWMVHVGLSAAYENRRDYDVLSFSDRPEANVDSDIRLIDTRSIESVNMTFKTGFEFAFQRGSLSLEAEYMMVDIDNGNDPRFDGYHVQVSYVLTGESRGYESGIFQGVTPKNKTLGAWEAAARWSSIDLNNSGVNGGKQENLTLGVNYYVTRNIRFMANAIFVAVTDSGAEVDGVAVIDDSPNIYMLRAQYSF